MGVKKNRRQFLVTLDVPEGVSVGEVVACIADAVACWPKSMSPDDPIFDLDGDSVKVKAVPKKQPAK